MKSDGPKTICNKRDKTKFDKLPDFFRELNDTIYQAIQRAGLKSNESPIATYYYADEAKKETYIAAALPVQVPANNLVVFETITIRPSKAMD